MRPRLIVPLAALALGACSCHGSRAAPAASAPSTPAVRLPPPEARDTTPPEDVERAHALVDEGMRLYREGQYDQAEKVLQEAITLYPFMAEANLTLAKILLIRASATHDLGLYTNARLMLEMAHALDPQSTEIEQLLELVRQPMTP